MKSDIFNWEKIHSACEKVCYFVIMNFLFWLFNLPVLCFFLFIGISQVRTYLPLFLACLLPMGPALSAVFYGMNRMVRGVERSAGKDFMAGYRTDLLQKWKLTAMQLVLLLIFWTNVEFFAKQIRILPLVILFFLLFVYLFLMTPYLYLLVSRYRMSTLSLIKTAGILTVTRPVGTLGNIASLGILLMAVELSAGTAMLFIASIYGFLIAFLNRNLLQKLEDQQKE